LQAHRDIGSKLEDAAVEFHVIVWPVEAGLLRLYVQMVTIENAAASPLFGECHATLTRDADHPFSRIIVFTPTTLMRLAVVTNILAPYRIPLFEELARRCDDFLVLLLADRHSSRDWVAPSVNFATRTLPGIRISRAGAVDPIHINVGAWRALRSFRPDVVLGGGFTPAHVGAMAYCGAHRKSYLSWGELILGTESEAFAPRRWLRHAMVRLSDGWIASSSASRDAFVHYGAEGNRVLVSLMPVCNAKFRSDAALARQSGECALVRARYPGPLIVSAGRLTDAKGWKELLGAMVQVRNEIPECVLVVAGDGPHRAEYQQLAQSLGLGKVFFIGPQTATEVAALYAAADLFVFPTLGDSFGAVLAEAIACGALAVASTHAAATGDLVTDGVSGFTINPRDHQTFAATLIHALRMPEHAKQEMSAAASSRLAADDSVAAAEAIVSYARGVAFGHGAPTSPHALQDT
jgi:glycosyltransferase involved in cell wall biosynthesis